MSKGKSILSDLNDDVQANQEWLAAKDIPACTDCSKLAQANSTDIDKKLKELKVGYAPS